MEQDFSSEYPIPIETYLLQSSSTSLPCSEHFDYPTQYYWWAQPQRTNPAPNGFPQRTMFRKKVIVCWVVKQEEPTWGTMVGTSISFWSPLIYLVRQVSLIPYSVLLTIQDDNTHYIQIRIQTYEVMRDEARKTCKEFLTRLNQA